MAATTAIKFFPRVAGRYTSFAIHKKNNNIMTTKAPSVDRSFPTAVRAMSATAATATTTSPPQLAVMPTEYLTSLLKDPSLVTDWSPSSSVDTTTQRKTLSVYDPASPQTLLAEIAVPGGGDDNHNNQAEAAAYRAIEECHERLVSSPGGWRDETTASHRSNLLRTWSRLMQEHQDDLATLVTLESGKPFVEATAEVNYARSFLDYYAGEALRPTGAGGGFLVPTPFAVAGGGGGQQPPKGHVMAVQQAVGVSALIAPWNFPLAMITRKVGPALAAGCTAVAKPSDLTPLSALALQTLAGRAGIDAGVFQLVVADSDTTPAVGTAFCTHPLVKKVSFTGSTRVGKILMQQAAGTVKRSSMELGGNACFVVFDDADIDVAVDAAIASKFRNAGQTCVASDRFLIQRGVHDEFVHKLAAKIEALNMGPGLEAGVNVGPLISSVATDAVEFKVQDALTQGARCVTRGCGGLEKAKELGPQFSPPTLLIDVPVECSLWKDETFGPVVAVRSFDTEEEALAIANGVDVGLASYFCTRDLGRAFRFAYK